MLDHTNLEEFANPLDYDAEYGQHAVGVPFYLTLAQECHGAILELACGTGKATIPLARHGLDITGLDLVPAMLARARQKSAGLSIRWLCGDARAFHLTRQFQCIFMTGNAFQAFVTRNDQDAMLTRVREHLAPDGVFAFETRNPRFSTLVTSHEEAVLHTYTNAQGCCVRVTGVQRYDHVHQILHYTIYRRWQDARTGSQETISRIALRYVFPQEMDTLLHYNGFHVERRYGDWNLSPLTEQSPLMLYVCTLR